MPWYGHGLVHPFHWSAIPQDGRCSLNVRMWSLTRVCAVVAVGFSLISLHG